MGKSKSQSGDYQKKHKHGKLGEIANKRKLDAEETRDLEDALGYEHWESYCGACDYFDTADCPHLGKVVDITRWRTDISCNKFND